MKTVWGNIDIHADKRLKVIDITDDARKIAESSGIENGIATVFNPHVTSAVCVNERDPELWKDLIEAYGKLVPLEACYNHNAKYSGIPGEQNAHAHILNTMIGHCASLPVKGGKLVLGTWQSVLFIELDGGKKRRLTVQIIGE